MSEELKQCPFCGGNNLEKWRSWVECKNCKYVRVAPITDDVIQTWNTRPLEDEKDKEIIILKSELAQARYVLNSIFDMAKRNNGVVHFSNDDTVWQISTDATDIVVGSMEEKK